MKKNMRLMDVVNENDEVVRQADLGEVHQKNLLHRATHVLIINSSGRIFCRQRSYKKVRYPGYWSTSTGKHVMSGETYEEVAGKSLESLGISSELKFIGKDRVNDGQENEINAVYICKSDEKLSLDLNEVEGGKFLTKSEVKKLTKRKNVTPHLVQAFDMYLKHVSRS